MPEAQDPAFPAYKAVLILQCSTLSYERAHDLRSVQFETMAKRTKLALTWIGKEPRPRLEPRILLENTDPQVPQKVL